MTMSARVSIPQQVLPLIARPAQRITPTMNILTPTRQYAIQSQEKTLLRNHSALWQPHSFSDQLRLLPSSHQRTPRTTWTLTSMRTSPHRLLMSINSEPRCARTSRSTAPVDMETSVHSLIPANTSWSKPRYPFFTRLSLATTTVRPDTAPME